MRRHTRFHLSFLLLALCTLTRPANAQFDNRAWTTYLHVATCNDIVCLQDTVWMATGEAGLVRYVRSTGTWSSITREPNGLAGNDIQCLQFDARGRMFAGVIGKGVSWLDTDGRWALINEFDGLPSDTALVMRAQGDTVWIGTTRGLALWNGAALAGSIPDLGTPSPFGSNQINGIGFTGDTMFVATPVGVYFARKSERLGTWTLINNGLPLNPNVKSLASNGRDVFVVASGVGITTSFQWFPPSGPSNPSGTWVSNYPGINTPNANSQVRRVRDDYGRIFCTTVGPLGVGGIYRWRTGTSWDLSPDSPRTDNTDDLAVEPALAPDDTMFASTIGLLIQEAGPNWHPRTPPGPIGNNTTAIFWAGGSVYANYNGEGVSRLRDGLWRNWSKNDVCLSNCDTTFQSNAFPFGALVDPDGTKWIGNWSGPLAHFDDTVDPPRFQNIFSTDPDPVVAHLHSCVWSSAADRNLFQQGRWFGLDTDSRGTLDPIGIDLYDSAGTFRRNYGPPYPGLNNGQIRALAVDKTNTMWVGYASNSTGGLSTFPVPATLGEDIVLTDVAPNDTKNLDCFGIQVYGDSVWVLGVDGLRRFDRGPKTLVTRLEVAGPPPPIGATHPLAVAPDGSVFAGTGAGVRWYRKGVAPLDFTPANTPLANIEVRAVFVEPSGVLWIGTATGINRFDPHFIPPPAPVLPALNVTLYPNPAWRTGAGFELKIRGAATHYEGELYDVRGRLVHRFAIDGNDHVVWNGFDMDGRGVAAGVYFMIVRGGGAEAKSRIVVLR